MNARAKDLAAAPLAPVAPALGIVDRLHTRASRVIEAPEIGGLVIVHEARLADVLPHLDEAKTDPPAFMKRMLAACVEIDGERLAMADFDEMGMRLFQDLQKLLPVVLEMNGMEALKTPAKKD